MRIAPGNTPQPWAKTTVNELQQESFRSEANQSQKWRDHDRLRFRLGLPHADPPHYLRLKRASTGGRWRFEA